jgi:Ni/Fe-hydrogenase 1 B-type cytochrome subunit
MSQPVIFRRYYVWEFPVRLAHWVNVLAIVLLSITGFLIGHPVLVVENTDAFLMGWVRFIHFVAGYTLLISVIARLLWSLRDHCFSCWHEYFPFLTKSGRKKIVEMLKFYFFINRKTPGSVGHNPLAVTAYVCLEFILFGMFITGFALYAEHAPGGTMHALFKPVYALISTPQLHLYHHLGMWLIIGFFINHLYSVWLLDVKEKGGEITSIFSGYKYTTKIHVFSGDRECDETGCYIRKQPK